MLTLTTLVASLTLALAIEPAAPDSASNTASSTASNPAPNTASDALLIIRELQQKVRDLEATVDQLKAAQTDNWLTQQRADEIRGLIHDVLADADTRASLLQNSATAGYDNGFFLGSADGNFLLRIGGQLQVRAVYNSQDDSPTDDHRYGFEIRRFKLNFEGHVINPTWRYQIELDTDRNTGSIGIGEWAYIQKDLGNGWKVRGGQIKPRFLREDFVSSKRLLLVERSLVNSQFTAGVSQGLWLSHEAERSRAYITFNDGAGTRGSSWNIEDTEYAFTGRAEWLALGENFKAVDDYSAWPSIDKALLIGAGILWQEDEYGTGDNLPAPDFNNAEVENLSLTADITFKARGYSISGAIVYRSLESVAVDLEQLGVMIQGGVFITDECELVARYEWGDLDIAGIDDLSILTIGVNKYFAGHTLKWQSDIGYAFNAVADQWDQSSAGWRADSPDSDGQIVIRTQMQLVF